MPDRVMFVIREYSLLEKADQYREELKRSQRAHEERRKELTKKEELDKQAKRERSLIKDCAARLEKFEGSLVEKLEKKD